MRFLLSWAAWSLGHLASVIMNWVDTEWWIGFWYPIYNWFMNLSSDIQGSGKGPWEQPVK